MHKNIFALTILLLPGLLQSHMTTEEAIQIIQKCQTKTLDHFMSEKDQQEYRTQLTQRPNNPIKATIAHGTDVYSLINATMAFFVNTYQKNKSTSKEHKACWIHCSEQVFEALIQEALELKEFCAEKPEYTAIIENDIEQYTRLYQKCVNDFNANN